MTQDLLSEADAWREIAERVDLLSTHEGYLCDQVGYLANRFFQSAPFVYPDEPRIDEATAKRMTDRVDAYIDGASSAYPTPYFRDDHPAYVELRQARILAALWLALEAEDEAEAVS